jgi:hypothetical protein
MLTFDAMWVRSEFVYREYLDRIVGLVDTGTVHDNLRGERCSGEKSEPANLLLVFMLRSIFKEWKQVIGYALLKHGSELPHTELLLMDALRRCHAIGANVVAVVCDMDTSQQKLANNLGVCTDRPFFAHPSTGQSVYFMFDPPHLFKCIRNNLLNYDFEFEHGKFASWRVVRALYQLELRSELKSVPKLTAVHVNLPLGKKMSVRHATEVFSHSVAASMMAYLDNDSYCTLPSSARVSTKHVRDTADFIRNMNRLWDIFNAAHTADSYGKKAITRQILADRLQDFEMYRINIANWRFVDQRSNAKIYFRDSLPFKKGLCITLAAMEQLCAVLFENTDISFVAPRRFNQDCLENTFCQVRRDKGSFNDILDASRAVSNLRTVAFATILSSAKSSCSNSLDDGDMVLIDCFKDLPPRIIKRSAISAADGDNISNSYNVDVNETNLVTNDAPSVSISNISEWHDSVDDAWLKIVSEEFSLLDKVQYVAGYLLQKAIDKRCAFVECNQCQAALYASEYEQRAFMRRKTYDFAVRGLLTPSAQLLIAIHTWERLFVLHFERLLSSVNLLQKLQNLIPETTFIPTCHAGVVREFLTRTFLRLRIHHACRVRTRDLRDDARRASLRKLAKLGTSKTSKSLKRPANN